MILARTLNFMYNVWWWYVKHNQKKNIVVLRWNIVAEIYSSWTLEYEMEKRVDQKAVKNPQVHTPSICNYLR